VHVEKKKLVVGTSDGSITLEKVKPQDRNVISGIDFKNGFHVKEGEVFG
jgi:methionyl-tRNA formyltransferase